MPRDINYDEIIDNLVRKTEQGKLSWNPTAQENAFICVLEGEFTFRILKFHYERAARATFSMSDKENNDIFVLSVSFGEPYYQKLVDLHEVARSSAIDVDGKLNRMSDILKRL